MDGSDGVEPLGGLTSRPSQIQPPTSGDAPLCTYVRAGLSRFGIMADRRPPNSIRRSWKHSKQGVCSQRDGNGVSIASDAARRAQVFIARPPPYGHALCRVVGDARGLDVDLGRVYAAALRMESLKTRCPVSRSFIFFRRELAPAYFDHIMGFCQRAKFSATITQESDHVQTNLGLVAAGLGLSLLPKSVTGVQREGVVYRPLAPPIPYVETGVVYPARRSKSNAPSVPARRPNCRPNNASPASRLIGSYCLVAVRTKLNCRARAKDIHRRRSRSVAD